MQSLGLKVKKTLHKKLLSVTAPFKERILLLQQELVCLIVARCPVFQIKVWIRNFFQRDGLNQIFYVTLDMGIRQVYEVRCLLGFLLTKLVRFFKFET